MSEFIQIMRFRTDDYDTLNALVEQYRTDTAGRSTYTSEVIGRDLDTGEHVVIVTFPSKEAADANNSLPETAAMALSDSATMYSRCLKPSSPNRLLKYSSSFRHQLLCA